MRDEADHLVQRHAAVDDDRRLADRRHVRVHLLVHQPEGHRLVPNQSLRRKKKYSQHQVMIFTGEGYFHCRRPKGNQSCPPSKPAHQEGHNTAGKKSPEGSLGSIHANQKTRKKPVVSDQNLLHIKNHRFNVTTMCVSNKPRNRADLDLSGFHINQKVCLRPKPAHQESWIHRACEISREIEQSK